MDGDVGPSGGNLFVLLPVSFEGGSVLKRNWRSVCRNGEGYSGTGGGGPPVWNGDSGDSEVCSGRQQHAPLSSPCGGTGFAPRTQDSGIETICVAEPSSRRSSVAGGAGGALQTLSRSLPSPPAREGGSFKRGWDCLPLRENCAKAHSSVLAYVGGSMGFGRPIARLGRPASAWESGKGVVAFGRATRFKRSDRRSALSSGADHQELGVSF